MNASAGNQPTQGNPQGQPRDGAAPTPATVQTEAQSPGSYPAACEEGSEAYNAVLCAQWRATIAAEESAEAAHEATLIGAGSAILGLATIVALFVSILQTQRGLRQGRQANETFAATSQKELRAYVVPRDQALINFAPGMKPTFVFKLHNSGQTPAYDVRCVTLMWATDGDVDDYRFFFRTKAQGLKFSRDIISADDFKVHTNPAHHPFGENSMNLVIHGHLKLIFAGIVSYRDVFGKRHLSTFRQFLQHDGDPTRATYDLTSCATGNYGN